MLQNPLYSSFCSGDALGGALEHLRVGGEVAAVEQELAADGERDLGLAAALVPPQEPVLAPPLQPVRVEHEAGAVLLRLPLDQVHRVRFGAEQVAVGARGAVHHFLKMILRKMFMYLC